MPVSYTHLDVYKRQAQRGAVDDIRAHFFAVLIGILHIELLGEELIDLNRDDGVLLAKDVFVLDIELGAVESGLVDADGIRCV